MATEKRVVCHTCKANWFVAPQGKCPACGSPHIETRDCEVRADGTVVVE